MKKRFAFWFLVAAATLLGTFVVPFLFPLKVPVFSPVYTAGGNNRVGSVLAALVSVCTALLCWRFGWFPKPNADSASRTEQPSRKWLWIAAACVTFAAALLGALMVREGLYYADAGYFLTQLRAGLVFHKALYRGVEFAYGPLLYYWPALFLRVLATMRISPETAYVVSLCAMEAVGTAMLFYTVNAMPMRRNMKLAAFLLLCIATLDPQEGLNYTAFRFIFSVASLVLLSRQKDVPGASTVAALAAIANFALSPEMGVAFGAAAAVYAGYRVVVSGGRWAFLLPALLAGSALFYLLVGADSFRTLREFANGGYNMLLEPAPHIYLLLFCVVGLAPLVVASALAQSGKSWRSASENGLLIGTYIIGLALLPAALGRCDPLHVSFNGFPMFLLSFIALDRMRLPARRIGLAIGLLFATYSVAQEYALGSGPVRKLITQRPDPYEQVDMPRLLAAVQGGAVSFPWYTPMRAADELTAAGKFQPLYLCIAAVDADAERRTVQNIRDADYVMAPRFIPLASENKINNVGMKARVRFGYQYKARRQPYYQGALLVQELQAHWRPLGIFGSYELYKKVD